LATKYFFGRRASARLRSRSRTALCSTAPNAPSKASAGPVFVGEQNLGGGGPGADPRQRLHDLGPDPALERVITRAFDDDGRFR
jgi:hypothetical protein